MGLINDKYKTMFIESMDDNLNTSKALAVLWELVKDSEVSNKDKLATILDFDTVLGLNLKETRTEIIPDKIIKLANERLLVRMNKDWESSDRIRLEINNLGYEIKDIDNTYEITKK